jgi:hypothetical protein
MKRTDRHFRDPSRWPILLLETIGGALVLGYAAALVYILGGLFCARC